MTRLRQFVALMIMFAIASLFSAPLLACTTAGHRCAMMSHAPKAVAKHACCHDKGDKTPEPAKQRCHKESAILPAAGAASTSCCEMGNAPVVTTVQAEPAKRSTLAVLSEPPPETMLVTDGDADRSSVIPRHPRPVFELKTDLRI